MTFADNYDKIHEFLLQERLIKIYHEIMKIQISPIIIESVYWLLGNLVANKLEERDIILSAGFLDRVFELLQTDKLHEGFLKTSLWFISTLLKYPLNLNEETRLKKCLEIFISFIKLDDEEIRSECLSGLSKLTEYDLNEIHSNLINSDTCRLILSFQNKKYAIYSIRILGNLLTGNNHIVDYLIENGVINFLQKYLFHKFPNVKREALWALSNITAGTVSQVKFAINTGVIMNAISLTKDDDRDLVREALLVVTNAVANSDEEALVAIKNNNLIECYCFVLKNFKDPELMLIVLKSIVDFLKKGDIFQMTVEEEQNKENPNAVYFESKGGLEVLNLVLFNKNDNIYKFSEYIYETWFPFKQADYKL